MFSGKKRPTSEPSPMQPTPSPQMGRLQINSGNQSGSMAPPPARSAGSSSIEHHAASKPSPGGDFLADCLQLNNQALMSVRKPNGSAPAAGGATSRRPPPSRPSGTRVHTVPNDWALKRGGLITSSSSLAWCTQSLPSARAAALRGHPPAADAEMDDGPDGPKSWGVALERALLQWRHPAHRLPPMLAKQLSNAAVGSPEKEYADGLNDSWDAALRSLFLALRDGRCPYFYCRAEAPREASAATAGHFCVLWRNGAAIEEDDPRWSEPPLGSALTDASSCYAVLSPSSHGLRALLDKARVPFEMPLAPAGTRDAAAGASAAAAATATGTGVGAAGSRARAGSGSRAAADDDPEAEDAQVLASLNRGRHEEQPDSVVGRQRRLAGVDHQQGSTLLFRGRDALHGLHEFLLNTRTAGMPAFLSLQLLAPVPFLHGAPYAPRLVHQPGRTTRAVAGEPCAETGAELSAAGLSAGLSDPAAAREDTLRLEDAERGGGALLLPSSVRKLTDLLRRTQSLGFELRVQPDAAGAASDALNLRPAHPPTRPCDIGWAVAPRPQPLARVWIAQPQEDEHMREPAPAAAPPVAASGALGLRGFTHVRCHEGELSIL